MVFWIVFGWWKVAKKGTAERKGHDAYVSLLKNIHTNISKQIINNIIIK